MQTMQQFKFGYSFLGNHKTMKLRYKYTIAKLTMDKLPKMYHKDISIYVNKGATHVTLACVAHAQSPIWNALNLAMGLAKADAMRKEADVVEHWTKTLYNVQTNLFSLSA